MWKKNWGQSHTQVGQSLIVKLTTTYNPRYAQIRTRPFQLLFLREGVTYKLTVWLYRPRGGVRVIWYCIKNKKISCNDVETNCVVFTSLGTLLTLKTSFHIQLKWFFRTVLSNIIKIHEYSQEVLYFSVAVLWWFLSHTKLHSRHCIWGTYDIRCSNIKIENLYRDRHDVGVWKLF